MGTKLDDEGSPARRKRNRLQSAEKLPPLCEVEVRSLKDNLLGSWHPGKVVACNDQSRDVKFDFVLADNGSDKLIESIPLSPFVDGFNSGNHSLNRNEHGSCNRLRRIRPLPPLVSFDLVDLVYGLCVDVYFQQSWWDGVIFDHNDGSSKRNVFFPDLGDELITGVSQIRLSQDWNEDEDSWHPRGIWFFLQMVEDYTKNRSLPLSVNEIWHDLQEKVGFGKVKEWTTGDKSFWQNLVSEAVRSNLGVCLGDVSPPTLDLRQEHLAIVEYAEAEPVAELDSADERSNVSKFHVSFKATYRRSSVIRNKALEMTISDMKSSKHSVEKSSNWKPISRKLVPEAKFSPDSIAAYLAKGGGPNNARDLRQHLLYMGWYMEFSGNNNKPRVRYFSPNGKCYYSLMSLCRELRNTDLAVPLLRYKEADKRSCSDGDDVLQLETCWEPISSKLVPGPKFCPDSIAAHLDKKFGQDNSKGSVVMSVRQHLLFLGWRMDEQKSGDIHRVRYSSPSEECFYSLKQVCRALREKDLAVPALMSSIDAKRSEEVASLSSRVDAHSEEDEEGLHFEPAYCPEAVIAYNKLSSAKCQNKTGAAVEELRLKIRQHLAAVGWSFHYRYKVGGREMIYVSPKRKQYNSLRVVCKDCIDEGGIQEISGKTKGPRGKQIVAYIAEKKVVVNKRSSANVSNNIKTDKSTRLLRSNKRVKEISRCPLQQNPRNLLSWLVDNNMVLPRAKLFCQTDRGGCRLAEGRFHHDGIKCLCCNKVFTLCGFNHHARIRHSRPSSRIFLEDGRSLLDCQMQVLQEKMNCLIKDPEVNVPLGDNDNICSVCHYGGDLILCDRCPSSFHKGCIGLDDIPDGDWFCPSCCCRVCGQSKLDSSDCRVLTCGQCDSKYHVGCVESGNLPRGQHWYCSEKCQKISVDLWELVGKPIMVGDGLTWTLLKFVEPNSRHISTPDLESSAEHYVKLNIAQDVMHECFETVKETYTKRDLIEDVIFSRGSELNRLNFRGFYTVVLEKNEELVTAANVRVHGDKVAELPLIGTRFKFRRLGMCRILMNELEKNLKELGVERLILPAVPCVLKTWTTSFGFAKMTKSERQQLLDHTFLDFQDTVMCQKHLLRRIPLVESSTRKVSFRFSIEMKESNDVGMEDASSVSSEVLQADNTMETSETVDQGLIKYVSSVSFPTAVSCENCINSNNRGLKYYKRRKYKHQPCDNIINAET